MLHKVYCKVLVAQNTCPCYRSSPSSYTQKYTAVTSATYVCTTDRLKHCPILLSCVQYRVYALFYTLRSLTPMLSISFSSATIISAFHYPFSIISSNEDIVINSLLECICHRDTQREAKLSCWPVCHHSRFNLGIHHT